jgi:hypothetical protein
MGATNSPRRHTLNGSQYKQQGGWENVLARFPRGGGTLLDLEFLTDDKYQPLFPFGP